MKPLRLRMRAFGPYATEVEINFEDLQDGGLFLIHGQTGAGKTSILDGLCFSLFGTTSGSERSSLHLRSDLAKQDLSTETELEFVLGPQKYKISRSPRQSIRKRRGQGQREIPSKGELHRWIEGAWQLLASGDKKTDQHVIELIGMSESQFRQVVILPQGQFRKFLSSTSEEREDLLQTLFRTHHYAALTSKLQASAVQLSSQISQIKQNFRTQLEPTGFDSLAKLESRTSELKGDLENQDELRKSLDSQFTEATRRLEIARQVESKRLEIAAQEARRAKLDEKRALINDYALKLERERRARPVLLLDGELMKNEESAKRLSGELAQASEALSRTAQLLDDARRSKEASNSQRATFEAEQSEYNQLTATYKLADSLRKTEDACRADCAALAKCEALADANEKALRDLRDHRDRLRSMSAELTAELETSSQAKMAADTLRSAVAELNRDLTLHEQKSRDLAEAQLATARAEAAQTTIAQTYKVTKLAYHQGQAALLARELTDGTPCPVCGSVEHPARALEALGDVVGLDEVDQLETALREATNEALVSRSQALRLADELRLLTKWTTREDAEVNLKSLEKELAEQVRRVSHFATLETRLRTAQVEIQALEPRLDKAESVLRDTLHQRTTLRERVLQSRNRIEELKSEIPSEWREPDLIKTRGQELRRRLDLYKAQIAKVEEELQTALTKEASGRARVKAIEEEYKHVQSSAELSLMERDRALAQSSLESLADVRASALTEAQLQTFTGETRRYGEDFAAVQARLKDLREEERTWPAWAFDARERELEYKAADSVRNQSRDSAAALKERIKQMSDLTDRLRILEKEIAGEEKKFASVGKLAAVAAGQPPHNLSRVNFPRFVLASRLDEVLEHASRRFHLMSRGQFTLRRSRSVDDKRKNAGLDLEVEDSFTGTVRPTSSLSGGEGFLASLALALGLADVVQSRLGGVRLDAVFVDEGFGTLDGEALDLAMQTLTGLQSGGRMVGVISHVPELRDQIARRLYVSKTPLGSQIRWDLGAAERR